MQKWCLCKVGKLGKWGEFDSGTDNSKSYLTLGVALLYTNDSQSNLYSREAESSAPQKY